MNATLFFVYININTCFTVPCDEKGHIKINMLLDTYCLREVIADWKLFGIHLGVSNTTIEEIDQKLKVEDCLRSVLVEWIKKNEGEVTIPRIIQALRSLDDHRLADELPKNEDVIQIMNRK